MIYLTLFEKLKEKLTLITEIKSIDWYNQQYENTEKDYAEPYPAVYIEFLDPIQWQSAGQKMQQATMRMIVHCVVHDLKTEPNACFNLGQKVFKSIHHCVLFDGDNQLTTELVRNTSELPKRFKNLKVVKIGFQFECFDITGMDEVINILR